MTERVGERNAYYCQTCRGYIVTVNLNDGTTPFMLACRVKGEPGDPDNDCRGLMRSMYYPAQPWPKTDDYDNPIPTEPTYEWYILDPIEWKRLAKKARHGDSASEQTLDHITRGGLLLRRVET